MIVGIRREEEQASSRIDAETMNAIRQFLDRIKPTYPVMGAILFGSRARGDHSSDSDADLAVLLDERKRDLIATKREMAGPAYDVYWDTDILVSAFPIWRSQWEHPETMPNPYLLRNIIAEGVEIDIS